MKKINKKNMFKGVVITIPFATLMTGGGVIIKEYTNVKTQIIKNTTETTHIRELFNKFINEIRSEFKLNDRIHTIETTIARLYERKQVLN